MDRALLGIVAEPLKAQITYDFWFGLLTGDRSYARALYDRR